jgi:hypothetical protein
MVRQKWTKKEANKQYVLAIFLASDLGAEHVDENVADGLIPEDRDLLIMIKRYMKEVKDDDQD